MGAILIVSLALQIAAVVAALRLIRTTGRAAAWLLISGAILIMAVRRAVVLGEWFSGKAAPGIDWGEVLALAISALMLAGILSIGGLFRAFQESREALREGEERFRAIADFTCGWEIWIGPDGAMRWVNPGAANLTGYAPEEILAMSDFPEPLVDPEDREIWRDLFRRAKEERTKGEEIPIRLRRRSGERFWGAISWQPIYARDGRWLGLRVSVRDVSRRIQEEEERQAMEAKVREAQKLESLGVLAGGIAHDFNNILMGILGHASLAARALPADSELRPSIEKMETAALRAAELTKQLMTYAGKERPVSQPLDVSRLIEEMADLVKASLSKKAQLALDLAGQLPVVEGDPPQIRQVVMNLLTNAADALGARGGAIVVKTGSLECDRDYLGEFISDRDPSPGTYVFLEVSDNGSGMDKDTVARIFDPFYSTKADGRGLGLATVLSIIRGHRGAIRVYSTPGIGTTIKALFPAAGAARERREAPAAAPARWRGFGKILVADDEEMVRELARRVLEEAGFEVVLAEDGRAAVLLFQQHAREIAVVLLDMTMPRLSGEEVFLRLRELDPGIPIILTSGYTEQLAIGRFSPGGLAGFIQKPYRPADLLAKLQRVLAPVP